MSGKRDQATKGAALSVATAMLAWAAQMFAQGSYTTAGIGGLIGVVIFVGYQALEERSHRGVYDDVVGAIGEERFRRLANHSEDTLDRLAEMDPQDAESLLGTSGESGDSNG